MNTPLTIPQSHPSKRQSRDSVWPLRNAEGKTYAEAKKEKDDEIRHHHRLP